ncbi:hypothetical protein SanJ4211_1068 [Streptococcus anginosus]|nr:hypothetical protein SanJ4211_1068 [Streptococcus anginosus]
MISLVFSFDYRNQRLVNRDFTLKLLCASYLRVTVALYHKSFIINLFKQLFLSWWGFGGV